MSRYDVEKNKWNEKASTKYKPNERKHYEQYSQVFTAKSTLCRIHDFFGEFQPGSNLLDYGCGTGWTTTLLAQNPLNVQAFDISINRIKYLNSAAAQKNLTNIHAVVADGERLPYQDGYFDYVFGNAILHHIELDHSLAEISRVLKPGGMAAFAEPFAHNPVINLYRYVKHHHLEKFTGTDKPLRYDDFPLFERFFSHVRFVETSLTSEKIPALRPVERFLLQFGPMRKMASYIAILLRK